MTGVRPMVAPGAMAIAACAGAVMMLAEPAGRALAKVRQERETLEAELSKSESAREMLPGLLAQVERARARVEEIEGRSAPVKDQPALVASLHAIAAASGLRLESVDPMGGGAAGATEVTATAYHIGAVGGFGEAAAFVRAVQHELGYTRIRMARLSPVPGPGKVGLVSLTIETEHLGFAWKPIELAPPD